MRAKPWWEDRILGAYMSYWIYQHLGNLSPARLYDDPIFCAVQDADGDCADLVRDFARTAAREIAGRALELPPRLRPHPPGRRRLARRARARRGPAPDALRQGVGVGRGPLLGRLRPPHHRDLAARPARRRDAPPRGLERGGLRRRLGPPAGAARREGPPGPRPRALGGLPALLQPHRGAARGRRGGSPRTRAGDDHAALGRRAPRLCRRGLVSRPRGDQPRAAGHVLADPQPARQARAPRAARRLHPARRGPCPRAGASGGRAAGADPLDLRPASPRFDNQIARLDLRGREARLSIEKTVPEDWQAPRLHPIVSLDVARRRRPRADRAAQAQSRSRSGSKPACGSRSGIGTAPSSVGGTSAPGEDVRVGLVGRQRTEGLRQLGHDRHGAPPVLGWSPRGGRPNL